jgi:hypothetical protein
LSLAHPVVGNESKQTTKKRERKKVKRRPGNTDKGKIKKEVKVGKGKEKTGKYG